VFDLIDIKDTKVFQEAFEEGIQEGLLKGRLEGMQKGIEIVLESKFGIEGMRLIPEIRNVKDIITLETISAALRIAKAIEELRIIYPQ
jgi:predicted transposase YdaD